MKVALFFECTEVGNQLQCKGHVDPMLSVCNHTCIDGGSLHKNESELFFFPLSNTAERLCECHHTITIFLLFPSFLHYSVCACSTVFLVFANHPLEFANLHTPMLKVCTVKVLVLAFFRLEPIFEAALLFR